jgi:hypothetical protein
VLACVPAPVFGEERSGLIDLSYSAISVQKAASQRKMRAV